MLHNPFMNNRRTTFDGYEFQEHGFHGWEESHTDVGYYTMLANKKAYANAGVACRIIKRRLKKADYDAEQLARFETEELNAKIAFLRDRIKANPDSTMRNKNRTFQIGQAERRIAAIN
jgi:hypothetical protein